MRAKVAAKTTRLPAGKVGKAYRATLRATGGVGPYAWRVTLGRLPVGIRLDRKTGLLTGAPRRAGTYRLTFTVTDKLGVNSRATLTLTIAKAKNP